MSEEELHQLAQHLAQQLAHASNKEHVHQDELLLTLSHSLRDTEREATYAHVFPHMHDTSVRACMRIIFFFKSAFGSRT